MNGRRWRERRGGAEPVCLVELRPILVHGGLQARSLRLHLPHGLAQTVLLGGQLVDEKREFGLAFFADLACSLRRIDGVPERGIGLFRLQSGLFRQGLDFLDLFHQTVLLKLDALQFRLDAFPFGDRLVVGTLPGAAWCKEEDADTQ